MNEPELNLSRCPDGANDWRDLDEVRSRSCDQRDVHPIGFIAAKIRFICGN
jgi:hypothetical protein